MAKRKCDQVVRPPSSYEEYLKLSKKDKLRLMKQNQAKRLQDGSSWEYAVLRKTSGRRR